MKTRVRWFVSNIGPSLLKSLGEQMLRDQFDPTRNMGFQMRHVRRDFLEGKFIERVESSETVEDPFGRTQVFARVEYRQTSFRVSASTPAIEVLDPARSCKTFLDTIWEYASGQIFIEPARAAVSDWLDRVEREVGSLTVLSTRVIDLSLSN